MIDSLRTDLSLAPELRKLPSAVSLWLGLAALGAVLCIRFPTLLANAEMRQLYPLGAIRALTSLSIGLAVAAGLFDLWRRRSKVALLGLAAAGSALLLGGGAAPAGNAISGRGALGLDWLVVDGLLAATLFLPLEKLFALRKGPSRREHWTLDLGYFALNHLGLHLLTVTGAAVACYFAARFGWLRAVAVAGSLPLWAQVPLLLVVSDVCEYWIHRALHEVPWLWRIHSIHHSSQKMDTLAGSRVHLAETVGTRTLITLVVTTLGFSFPAVLVYAGLITVQATLIHANVRFQYGWLEYVLVSPRSHHWHHSSEAEAIDTNYAGTFSLLDRLFGTHHLPAARWPQAFGVVKEQIPSNFLGQLLFPFT